MYKNSISTWALFAVALMAANRAIADDADALVLESAPVVKANDVATQRQLHLEGAFGNTRQRFGLGRATSRRISIDYSENFMVADGWRLTLSDRLDYMTPEDSSGNSTINSIREAYVLWRAESGAHTAEFGRINLRLGPAYGYNPTDYFRAGSLRTLTSVDPLALRRNRMGTVMFRFQRLWQDGSASVAVAPKLRDEPSDASFSADLGSTNRSNRALASWSATISEGISGQAHLYGEQGVGAQVGTSLTALLSKSVVAHLELSHGKGEMSLGVASAPVVTRNRSSTGLTYTLPSNLAVTAEYEYNGFAKDRTAWHLSSPPALVDYLNAAQDRQDIAGRRAWLLYATQNNFGTKNLDLTGLLRVNAMDNSRLAWLELRYHWSKADLAAQLTWSRGGSLSEYGLLPMKQSAQLLLVWHL